MGPNLLCSPHFLEGKIEGVTHTTTVFWVLADMPKCAHERPTKYQDNLHCNAAMQMSGKISSPHRPQKCMFGLGKECAKGIKN